MSPVEVEIPVDVKVDHEAIRALMDRFRQGDMTPNQLESEVNGLVTARIGDKRLDVKLPIAMFVELLGIV